MDTDHIRDMIANTEDRIHKTYDLVQQIGTDCLTEFIDAYGLTDQLEHFGNGYLRRGRRLAAAVITDTIAGN